MSVRELTKDQLDELRWDMWFRDCDDHRYDFNYKFEDITDITNEDIYKEHEGVIFSEDDFFCTMGW